jgi:hypothetical protein
MTSNDVCQTRSSSGFLLFWGNKPVESSAKGHLFTGMVFCYIVVYSHPLIDMGNPNPRPENLKAMPRMDDTTDPLAASALMARVPIPIDALVRSLPNRSAWLRRVITEAAQRELMKDGES